VFLPTPPLKQQKLETTATNQGAPRQKGGDGTKKKNSKKQENRGGTRTTNEGLTNDSQTPQNHEKSTQKGTGLKKKNIEGGRGGRSRKKTKKKTKLVEEGDHADSSEELLNWKILQKKMMGKRKTRQHRRSAKNVDQDPQQQGLGRWSFQGPLNSHLYVRVNNYQHGTEKSRGEGEGKKMGELVSAARETKPRAGLDFDA